MTDLTHQAGVLDRESLMEHVGHDTSLLSTLFSIFRDYYPELLTSLRDAIAQGDCSVVHEISHQFKGMVSNFYATAAFEVAQDLESAGRDNCLDNAEDLVERLEQELERMNTALSELCSQ